MKQLFAMSALACALLGSCAPTKADRAEARGVTLAAMSCEGSWRRVEAPPMRPRLLVSVTETEAGVLLFGGVGDTGALGDGALWRDGAWTLMPAAGAPSPRAGHVAVWLGDRLCVWGGERDGEPLGDGACWTPGAPAWRAMSSPRAPSPRASAGACWTGRELVLFGGQDADGEALGAGAAWNPVTDAWRALPTAGAPRPRTSPVLRCDGSAVTVWGGAGDALALGAEDAARYELATDVWSPLDLTGAPSASSGPLAVIVAEGIFALHDDGVALFDAGASRWRALRHEPTAPPRFASSLARVPGGAMVWGGRDASGLRADGACYDIARERWTSTPTTNAPTARSFATAFFDGGAVMVLWGRDARGLRDDAHALVR